MSLMALTFEQEKRISKVLYLYDKKDIDMTQLVLSILNIMGVKLLGE
jgi:hypothetical protein